MCGVSTPDVYLALFDLSFPDRYTYAAACFAVQFAYKNILNAICQRYPITANKKILFGRSF